MTTPKAKKIDAETLAEIVRALKSGSSYAEEAAEFYGTNWRGEVALKERDAILALISKLSA